MNTSSTCFEIVRLAFKRDVALPTQIELMKQIGLWASVQLGFLSRQSFHDPKTNLWTDVVEWQTLSLAHAAMERSLHETVLGEVMSRMSADTVQVGHYQRLI